MRLILNLKKLNKFIDTSHFKLEDLRTAVKLISEDCFLATLDLKDAYFLLNVHKDSRQYLRFSFEGKLYQFNVLPFGLNTAPYVFTKLMKPVVKLLRSAGYLSTLYLDDFLLIGRQYNDCLDNIKITGQFLSALGFKINEEKSNLVPSHSCKFLGYVIDSHNMQIALPKEKQIHIREELNAISKMTRCTVRRFAQLIGLLISACPAVEYGLLYTKALERCKFLNLKSDNDFDKYMNVPHYLSSDFAWWLSAIENPVHRIKTDQYAIEIFSDASTTGWGAACGEESANGAWSAEERKNHINYLELLAAYFAIKIFAKSFVNCQLLLRIDNSTAVSYINRMGGIQYPHLTDITKTIWQWCESRKIFVFASYIKSKDNTIADAESRKCHPDIEWELSQPTFEMLSDKFGTPMIDLFAGRLNKKCAKYVSWHKDPDAEAVDAFTINWSSEFFYAFPPFSIILKVLRKIILDEAKGIIIVPQWPTQAWYPIFQDLLVSDVVELKANEHVHFSLSSHQDIKSNLTLVAGILSGARYSADKCLSLP